MTRVCRAAIVCMGLWSSLSALAANFESRIFYGRRVHITMWGGINKGDDKVFKEEVLKQIRAGYLVTDLALFTPGGDVDAAVGIGEQIRLLEASTTSPYKNKQTGEPVCYYGSADRYTSVTDSRCECASACFIIWAGGIDRHGDYVRIHHPYYDKKYFGELDPEEARKLYEPMDKEVRSYFSKMQIPDSIVRKMFKVISKDLYLLNDEQVEDLHNPYPWVQEQIYDRCGDLPNGTIYDNPERKDYFECAGKIYDAIFKKTAQNYLNIHAPGETVPASPVPPAPTPKPSRTAPHPAAPTTPVVVPPTSSTRVVLTTGPNAYYFMRENRDLDGDDLKPFFKPSDQASCANACNNNSYCQGFSYDDWNHMCILKTNIRSSRLEPRSISGIKQTVGPFPAAVPDEARIDVYKDRYFPGDGYATFPAADTNACVAICKPHQKCVAFTFFKAQRLCRIFNSTSQYFKGDSGSSDIGIKTQSPP